MTDKTFLRRFLEFGFVSLIGLLFSFAADLGSTRNTLMQLYLDSKSHLNVVTEIYLDYRIFDTMLESLLLLVSVIAVVQFSNLSAHEYLVKEQVLIKVKNSSQIMETVLSLLFPFMLVFGLYVVLNGSLSPGGGFQGGAIFAAIFMCRHLVDRKKAVDTRPLAKYEKLIFLFILTTISFFILFRASFLPYREGYFLFMNLLISLKVLLGLIIIFYRFIYRGE